MGWARAPRDFQSDRRVEPALTKVTAFVRRPVTALERTDSSRLPSHSSDGRQCIECIQAGAQPLTNFAEAAKTMRLVDQIAAGRR